MIPTGSQIASMCEQARAEIKELSDEELAAQVCRKVLFSYGQQNYGYYLVQALVTRFKREVGIDDSF